ncbi:ABC transporter permease [Dongia sedimenti]|uniref:ABC transporter permease n=1 Tax=Dongia sedimenti TaxID=3064282 RepID=A0ABU0YKA4_9PROT|nr:ABC transporter permease [Rhodospirillaceae bacterium R-7]
MSRPAQFRFLDAAPSLILGVILIGLWEAAIHLLDVNAFVVPAPSSIAISLVQNAALLAEATLVTAKEVLVGFVLATLCGAALALLIVRFRMLGRALYPIIVLFQTVPKVALAPIFILWFGYDLSPKVMLIVVIAFFPVTLDMLAGLQSVDPGLVALMRSVSARDNDILLRVRIPNALPHLMAGMKIAITLSVIGAIVGEFAGASAGLGYTIQFASTQLDTPMVFAALVVVSVVGVAFYYLIELLERAVTPWAPKFDPAHQH